MTIAIEERKKKNSRENLVGQTFNELTVISFLPYHKNFGMWLCECECGNRKAVNGSNLKSGATKSCGCLLKGRKYGETLVIPTELLNVKSALVEDGIFRVFENGRIFKNTEYGPIEAEHSFSNGYKMVSNTVNGKQKHFYVHRLLSKAFIPNPENKPQVNHIDGDRANNSLPNLEWVTAKENVVHAYQAGLADYIANKTPCANCGEPTSTKDSICGMCKNEMAKEARKESTKEAIKETVSYMDIGILTDRQKEAVELRRQGLTLREIGEVLGVTRQGAESLIRKAELRMENKRLISKRDVKEIDVLTKRIKRKEDEKEKLLLKVKQVDIDLKRATDALAVYDEFLSEIEN